MRESIKYHEVMQSYVCGYIKDLDSLAYMWNNELSFYLDFRVFRN